MLFFTSDQHFNHKNVIKYSNRPFDNVDEMNETMIRRWNEKIKNDDLVYFIGDFAFSSQEKIQNILWRLNGRKILIFGNHDKSIRKSEEIMRMFDECHNYHEIIVPDDDASRGQQHITLCHFPGLSWNKIHYGAWMLHGHCHGNMQYPMKAKIYDVGVDCNNFAPVSYDEVKKIMSKKEYVPLDHHSREE